MPIFVLFICFSYLCLFEAKVFLRPLLRGECDGAVTHYKYLSLISESSYSCLKDLSTTTISALEDDNGATQGLQTLRV